MSTKIIGNQIDATTRAIMEALQVTEQINLPALNQAAVDAEHVAPSLVHCVFKFTGSSNLMIRYRERPRFFDFPENHNIAVMKSKLGAGFVDEPSPEPEDDCRFVPIFSGIHPEFLTIECTSRHFHTLSLLFGNSKRQGISRYPHRHRSPRGQ